MGVVITGGSRGLGYAVARELLRAGDRVVLCARDAERLGEAVEALRAEAGERVEGLACDIAQPEAARRLAELAGQRLGTVDRWINNAGTAGRLKRPLEALPAEDVHATCTTNLAGAMALSAEAVRLMRRQPEAPHPRYHLFNLGFSAFGAALSRTSIPHKVSKLAVASLSAHLRRELRRTRVRSIGVHELRPGLVRTELLLADAGPEAQRVIDALAEEPEAVARHLAPQIRAVSGTGRVLQRRSKPATLARALRRVPPAVLRR
nr:SDR family oxidoreductase [Halorhodospira neutriphila]